MECSDNVVVSWKHPFILWTLGMGSLFQKKKIDLKKKIKIKIKFKTYFCTTMVVIDANVLFFIECHVLKFMEEKPHW